MSMELLRLSTLALHTAAMNTGMTAPADSRELETQLVWKDSSAKEARSFAI